MADLSTPQGLNERLEEVQVLDVREPYEREAGRIRCEDVHIPLQQLMNGRVEGLDPSKPVVAYCRSGSRSELAKLLLQSRGFEAYNLESGTEGWVAEGLPLDAADGSPGRVA